MSCIVLQEQRRINDTWLKAYIFLQINIIKDILYLASRRKDSTASAGDCSNRRDFVVVSLLRTKGLHECNLFSMLFIFKIQLSVGGVCLMQ